MTSSCNKKLNPNVAGQKFVANFIKLISGDDLNYLLLFTKPLQPQKPRWYSIFKTWASVDCLVRLCLIVIPYLASWALTKRIIAPVYFDTRFKKKEQ